MYRKNRSPSPRQVRFRDKPAKYSSFSSQNSDREAPIERVSKTQQLRRPTSRSSEDNSSFYNRRNIKEAVDCNECKDCCRKNNKRNDGDRERDVNRNYRSPRKHNSTDDAASDRSVTPVRKSSGDRHCCPDSSTTKRSTNKYQVQTRSGPNKNTSDSRYRDRAHGEQGRRSSDHYTQQRHQSVRRDQSPSRFKYDFRGSNNNSSRSKCCSDSRMSMFSRHGRNDSVYKGNKDRRSNAQHNAAVVIQRNFRSFSGKVHYQELQYVAGTLQRFIRGYLIRKQMEELNAAATTVQRSYRNYRCLNGTQPRRRIIRASSDSLLEEDGNTVLVVGGVDIFEPRRYRPIPTGDICRFNSFTNEWQYVGITPDRRRYATATYLNGKVYVVGGVHYCHESKRSYTLNSMWILDPATAEWTRGPDMCNARVFHGAVAYLGELYILGGQDGNGCTLSSVETYCPRRDSWLCAPDLPHPRAGLAAVVYQHKIWVAGGMSNENKCPISTTVSLYDPFARKWSDGFPLRRSCCHGRLVVAADKLYLVGGLGRSERQFNIDSVARVETWDNRQRAWTSVAHLTIPRNKHSVVQYGADEFLVLGGDNSEMNALDSVEHFSARIGEFMAASAVLPGRFLGISAVFIPHTRIKIKRY